MTYRTFTSIVPMSSIEATMTSPGLIGPTPSGVPVRMTSPGYERVERRCVLDQLGDAENQIPGVGLLPELAVDRERGDRARRGREVSSGGDEPGTEDGVAVRRFAQAAFFRPPNRDVEADAVAGDVVERVGADDCWPACRSRRPAPLRGRSGDRACARRCLRPAPTSELVAFRKRPAF